jgi:hypothetical protein
MRGCEKRLEARVGIEPTHKGFADLSLTTWVPRLDLYRIVFRRQNPVAWRPAGQRVRGVYNPYTFPMMVRS